MIRDITLGQYYQADSVIHKMDPRVKLIATFVYIISLFVVDNFIEYAICFAFLATAIALSKVPVKFMVRGMKAILFLLIITVIFNLFLTPGDALISFWKLTITKQGVKMALTMAVRLSMLIIGSSVMTLTTTPNNLTDGLESVMKPLIYKKRDVVAYVVVALFFVICIVVGRILF